MSEERVTKSGADQLKAPEARPGAKPESKDDLKSLPMPEVEKKLGSSPDGLSQAEAQKRLTQYGPNEIAEKSWPQPHIEVLMNDTIRIREDALPFGTSPFRSRTL
jgi:magnesium-transporting ATPase (P-type)